VTEVLAHERWQGDDGRMRKVLISLLMMTVGACGGDDPGATADAAPITHSQAVGINLSIKSGDVTADAASDEKDIDSEAGNPYAGFVTAARLALSGEDPGSVDLSVVTLLLGGTSTGVTTLQQVFTGEVEVLFVMKDTNNTYNVATVTDPMGGGPVTMDIVWDPALIKASTLDWEKFLAGQFRVVIRGTATTGFDGLAADAKLQVTLTFVAEE
jgi:hypothetical protein